MKPKTKTSPLTKLAILTALTTLSWVSFEIYQALSQKAPPNIPPQILAPLNPNLDTQSLDLIKSRIQPDESTLPLSSPLATPTPLPTASPSEEIPSSTPSANIPL